MDVLHGRDFRSRRICDIGSARVGNLSEERNSHCEFR
jgi:hypothetical protein